MRDSDLAAAGLRDWCHCRASGSGDEVRANGNDRMGESDCFYGNSNRAGNIKGKSDSHIVEAN